MAINPITTQFTGDSKPFFAELGKVRQELGGLRNEASRISSAFTSVGNIIKAYVGFRAVTGTIRAVIDATAEAQAAQAQLNSALAAAGAEVKAASAAYNAHAQELQRTTNFSDEAVTSVQSLLLSFEGLSGGTIQRATDSVLDLATRMGMDAPAAAKLLGKALSDPERGLTALTRAGITFGDAQREAIKQMVQTGRTAEAQDLILEKLEERFGGAAAAARDTFGGALAGLKNAFGELLEGGEGINAASTAINDLTRVLSSDELKNAFSAAITGLATIITKAAEAAAGLAIVFSGGDGPNEQVNIDNRIRDLVATRKLIEDEIKVGTRDPLSGAIVGPLSKEGFAAAQARIAGLDAQIKELQAQWEEAGQRALQAASGPAPSTGLDFTTGGEQEAELPTFDPTNLLTEVAILDEIASQQRAAEIEAEQEHYALLESLADEALAAGLERAQAMVDGTLDASQERIRIEQETQDQINQLQAGGVNAALGLLQFLAQRSKTAAKALILLNRGLAIAQAVQNTAAAATKALAIYGPTPQGFAAAAAAKAWGAAQIGLIAATGALEFASIGPGGGGAAVAPGTPNNPIFTREEDSQQPGASQQRALQVVFAGPVYGMNDFRDQLVAALREEADERDVIIFSGNSRQAQELRR